MLGVLGVLKVLVVLVVLVVAPPAVMAQAAPARSSVAQATSAPKAAALPAAAEILARYKKAIGGEAAIRKHKSRRLQGTLTLAAQAITGKLTILAAAPDLMRMTVALPGLGEMQRGYDGKVGWSIDPAVGPRLLEGGELDELKHSADFFEDLYEAKKFKSITVVERTTFEGEDCYRLKFVRLSGFEYNQYFSVATGLATAMVMTSTTQMGTLPVTTIISDYKPFGGVLTATTTRQRMMGLESVVTIDEVDYGAVTPAAFALPTPIAALVAAKDSK